jgi:hypothetical protein
MIGSWRGLAIVVAIAAALAVTVAIDILRTGEATDVDRALVPGFDPARATELVWERPGQPAIRAVRTGERWELRAPGTLPADPGAIGDVLAALRGARWHRRGDAPPPHATLTVIAGAERHVLGFAAPIAGTEQSWIVCDGRGVVVDGWVARALDRDRLSLQVRRPLADAAGARTIAITGAIAGAVTGAVPASRAARPAAAGGAGGDGAGGRPVDLRIEGFPRRQVRPESLLLAPELATALERALRDLAIVRIPDGAPAGHGLAIEIMGPAGTAAVTVELGGACSGAPGLIAVSGTAGDGCVDQAAADAIGAALAGLRQPAAAIVERRPVPFEPARVVLPDGAALSTSPPRIGDAAADVTRVAELFAALAAPAVVVARPAGPPTAHVTATDRAGAAIALDLFADRVLARPGEPVALRPAPGAWSLLVRPSRELRDLTLWVEEPTMVTALVIDGVRYQRGAVIGAWDRQPAGPVDAARVEALVAQLAAPRALGFADGPLATAHRVTLEVTPPAGAPIHHALELGAPRGSGCPAHTGGDTVVLPAAICSEVAALGQPRLPWRRGRGDLLLPSRRLRRRQAADGPGCDRRTGQEKAVLGRSRQAQQEPEREGVASPARRHPHREVLIDCMMPRRPSRSSNDHPAPSAGLRRPWAPPPGRRYSPRAASTAFARSGASLPAAIRCSSWTAAGDATSAKPSTSAWCAPRSRAKLSSRRSSIGSPPRNASRASGESRDAASRTKSASSVMCTRSPGSMPSSPRSPLRSAPSRPCSTTSSARSSEPRSPRRGPSSLPGSALTRRSNTAASRPRSLSAVAGGRRSSRKPTWCMTSARSWSWWVHTALLERSSASTIELVTSSGPANASNSRTSSRRSSYDEVSVNRDLSVPAISSCDSAALFLSAFLPAVSSSVAPCGVRRQPLLAVIRHHRIAMLRGQPSR